MFTEVSITVRPFFERHVVVVLADQRVLMRGASLASYRIARHLARWAGIDRQRSTTASTPDPN